MKNLFEFVGQLAVGIAIVLPIAIGNANDKEPNYFLIGVIAWPVGAATCWCFTNWKTIMKLIKESI